MSDPEILVLMATHNGGPRLERQLASIAAQDLPSWTLRVRDDHSRDDTVQRVGAFAATHAGRVDPITQAPASDTAPGIARAARNFLTLLADSSDRPEACVALADQDDHWYPAKLRRATEALGHSPEPAIYASSFRPTDAALRPLGPPARFPAGPSFQNALVQGVLCGNTIVMNSAAAAVVRRSVPAALAAGVPSHDWWIYQIATGAGCRVILDPAPRLDYVQHDSNLIGLHKGWAARRTRLRLLRDGTYRRWLDANAAALSDVSDLLTEEARTIVKDFTLARRSGPASTRSALSRLGLHRQTGNGTRALKISARLGWL